MIYLQISEFALKDLESITIWSESKRNGLSFEFELNLEFELEVIIKNPLAFQNKYRNVKVRFLNKFPYGILYIFNQNTILDRRIFHTSQSPKNWYKRLSEI